MSRQKPRWLYELLVVLLLCAVGYGAWWWQGVQHRSEMLEKTRQLRETYETKEAEITKRLRAAASNEATAVATAFAAGIRPLVEEGRFEDVDAAVLSILELPGVAFVHVVDRDGNVLVSSDRKLLATGRVAPGSDWVLEAGGPVQRVAAAGVIEIAVPMPRGESEGDAVLWIGHDPRREST